MRTMLFSILTLTVLVLLGGGLAADQSKPANGPDESVVTMAMEYGLTRSQIASFDASLCGRLVRFGKVSMDRGRFLEAKRFFWKALLVDPTSILAWQCYDQAVVFALANRVERSPGLVGLPGMMDEPVPAQEAEPEIEEGC